MRTRNITDLLVKKVREKGILVAAHRGTKGANIIENTVDAFDCAIQNDADIVELDIVSSTDGVLYVFHDGNENRLLGTPKSIKEMTSAEIDACRYRNAYGKKTGFRVNRLDAVLAHLKGDVLINVDRCWDIFDSVIGMIRMHDMFDQVIMKCPPNEPNLRCILDSEAPIMFMAMVATQQELDMALALDLNLVAVEINFTSEQSPLLSEANIARLKERGILLWTNALSLKAGWTASAGHDDNVSITQNPDIGWGWLVDRGFDIIQTDWPMLLRRYLLSRRELL